MELATAIQLTMTYNNWRGETSERTVMPVEMVYSSTDWHPEPQWLLRAKDLDRGVERLFAVQDIHNWSLKPKDPASSVTETLHLATEKARQRVIDDGPILGMSVERQFELLEELLEELVSFELGRYLLQNRKLSAYWSDYIARAPKHPIFPKSELESFLLYRAPFSLATQQRFDIVQDALRECIAPGMRLGSMPSGLMSDLLTLDLSEKIELIGVDHDFAALVQAKDLATKRGYAEQTCLQISDVWQWKAKEALDVIVHNGLGIFERGDSRVLELYQNFWRALKPGGRLVTSFVTHPPTEEGSEWLTDKVSIDDFDLAHVIMDSILDVRAPCFRTTTRTTELLSEAGFKGIEVRFDEAHIFPTVIAIKPGE